MTEKKENVTLQKSSEIIELIHLIDFSDIVNRLYQKGVFNMPNSDRDIHLRLSMLSAMAAKIVENNEKRLSMRHHTAKTVVGAAIYLASKKLGITTTYRELSQALGSTPTAIINVTRQLNNI
jgi:hypothetical protein